jgi:hypothetical protein
VDVCRDSLPDCELLIARDFLFYLSFSDIDIFSKNIRDVNYRYLLTTMHGDRDIFNRDIVTGDFREIDLFGAPFNFSQACVEDRVDDFPPGYAVPREMTLIKKDKVPTSLSGL